MPVVQGGYAWGQDSRVRINAPGGAFNAPVSFRAGSEDTAFGGAHAGFNYQLGGIVLGIEGDVEALDSREPLRRHRPLGPRQPGLAGLGPRPPRPRLRPLDGLRHRRRLLYENTSGASLRPAAGFSERLTSARTGWNVGAGVNFAFTDNLILGAEYRYTDFGRNRFASSGGLPGPDRLATS